MFKTKTFFLFFNYLDFDDARSHLYSHRSGRCSDGQRMLGTILVTFGNFFGNSFLQCYEQSMLETTGNCLALQICLS
jgi:hypothetical protein